MTNVLVCIKRVPDTSSEVVLTADEQGVDGRFSGWTVSPHENCAVELAIQVAAATGGTATVLTLGPEEAVDQVRAALALGCTAAVHVVADSTAYSATDVAREVAAVVRDHAAAGTDHDLVLLGNDASDSGDFQVGIRLAHELGRPVVNGINLVEADGSGTITLTGEGAEGRETYRVPVPLVATVMEGGVEPRYPTVSGRVKAKKVAIETREPASGPSGPVRVRITVPPPEPSTVRVLGRGPEAAGDLVAVLRELGVTR